MIEPPRCPSCGTRIGVRAPVGLVPPGGIVVNHLGLPLQRRPRRMPSHVRAAGRARRHGV